MSTNSFLANFLKTRLLPYFPNKSLVMFLLHMHSAVLCMDLEASLDHILLIFSKMFKMFTCIEQRCTDVYLTFNRPPIPTIVYFFNSVYVFCALHSTNFKTNSELQLSLLIRYFWNKLNTRKLTYILNAQRCTIWE